MVCIYCGSSTQVTNSRHTGRNNQVWRRRRCKACQAVFTTHEATDLDNSLVVRKNGHLEAFHKNKLLISIYESCRHRETALSDAESLIDTVIQKLMRNKPVEEATIPLESITKTTRDVLRRFDTVAATYYGAYYCP